MMQDGATPSNHTSIPGDDARAQQLIRKTFMDAWVNRPTDSQKGRTPPKVTISLDRNGNVTHRALAVSSGSKAMDDSVMGAATAVRRIPNLPSGYAARNPTVTVTFELE